jgi:hypothetical protein
MDLIISKGVPEVFLAEYTSFLNQRESSLFYQYPVYHQLLEVHLSAEVHYFIWHVENKIIAVFPLMLKRNDQYGTVMNSLPYYGSNGSFVFAGYMVEEEKSAIRQSLMESIGAFYQQEDVLLSTIITSPLEKEDQAWFNDNWCSDKKDYRIGQITPMSNFSDHIEEDLMELYDNPRPRNIRRAIKAEVSISVRHGREAIDFLYKVHKENIESIGGLAKRKDFFDLIPSYFKVDEYAIYVAEKDGQPISALLLFYFNKTVEYFTPATIHEFRNDQPSALIIYRAMEDAVERGFKYWNWGGTWETQEGVYDFKKRWGAKDFRYEYFIQLVKPEVANIAIEELKRAFPNFYLYPY